MDGNGGEKGFKLKLPLAVLKVWGRENEEERRRKVETSYRGRRLRVVSRTRNFHKLFTPGQFRVSASRYTSMWWKPQRQVW